MVTGIRGVAGELQRRSTHGICALFYCTAGNGCENRTSEEFFGWGVQELVFDAEKKFVLHMEMAKKNLFVKRGVVTNSSSFDPSKRLRTGGEYTHVGYPSPSPSPAPPPAAPVWGAAVYMAPFDPYEAYQVPQVPVPAPAPLPAPSGYTPQNVKDNPPCNTLFIGNLGENIIEEELNGLFSVQSGYKRMKLLRQERNTVCFIEFDDVNSAMAVLQNLQGAVFPSSGSNTISFLYDGKKSLFRSTLHMWEFLQEHISYVGRD